MGQDPKKGGGYSNVKSPVKDEARQRRQISNIKYQISNWKFHRQEVNLWVDIPVRNAD